MNKINIDLSNGFYQSDSIPFSNQRLVNCYVNIPEAAAVSPAGIWGCEGIKRLLSINFSKNFKCRGAIEFRNEAYFVLGDYLYKVELVTSVSGDRSYKETALGRINGNGGMVSMAENGDQLMIVNDDGTGWIYQPNGSPQFSQITDAGFTANGIAQTVSYVDRYFIVTTDQRVAIISAVGDGTNWNSLDRISAEADPDDVVASFVFRNQLYLLGRQTTEQYQNIGGAGVPFQRVSGYVLSQGCSAKNSVVNVGDAVYWVGSGRNQKPVIYAFNGSQPQKVSSKAIDNILSELTDKQVSEIFAFSYAINGNEFIHFTFPDTTFVFNARSGKWHERLSEITDQNGNRTTIKCRITAAVGVFGDILVGDSEAGIIGMIDDTISNEYGEPLISFFTTQPIYNLNSAFTLPLIELFCETGVGNNDIPDPKIRLQISKDGAVFGNSKVESLGAAGNRQKKVNFRKIGRFDRLGVLKFSISDDVKRRIYSLTLRFKRGIK